MPEKFSGWLWSLWGRDAADGEGESPMRYKALRRNMILLMVFVTVIPLALMAGINNYIYQNTLAAEVLQPVKGITNKTKHSFELFLAERLSAVSFIASAYTYEELADRYTLTRVFEVMKKEFGGFVDLGLIDETGVQVSYSGPYDLKGKNYADQPWFQEVRVRGSYISDVFLGYRKFPHFVIAVMEGCQTGRGCWVLRATIDTEKFNNIIASMGLDATSDAFILNRDGVLQTSSKFYGRVLEKLPFPLPPASFEPTVLETTDPRGQEIIMGYTYFVSPAFVLMMIKPKAEILKTWVTLKGELVFIFLVGVAVIFWVIFRVTGQMVRRIEESNNKRQMVYHEMQYTNKLASIGRLAAGVAHEINNPLAIINEKAGLLKDLMETEKEFPRKEKFLSLANSIIGSVDRCRTITHRLLGFARRMDVAIEVMDLNETIREVLSFLEKEAMHRNLDLRLELADNLPHIASDRGQLQQVFLNIINNAFAAVSDNGLVAIASWEKDIDFIGASIRDNGVGMSEETKKHLFEPFFTTKKGYGTGLGLSITYGIVRKLGGQIEVQSKEGQGTTFTVFLPKKAKQLTE
ncbi:MAG: ATP-binding protein [Pseudomonadota bacterium]